MPKRRISEKRNFFVGIILSCVVIALAVNLFMQKEKPIDDKGASTREKGKQFAPIEITGFIDYLGFYCPKAEYYLANTILENPKRIYLEIKYFPLDNYKHSKMFAKFAECAGRQNRFWTFHYRLFKMQSAFRQIKNPRDLLENLAYESGLDLDALDTCLLDYEIDQLIQEHKQEGIDLGVKSVPTYFVNGQMVEGPEELERVVSELLL